MPPIPTTYDEETAHLISTVQRRETDLLEYQIPRLRDCKGPLSTQQDLATELREDIDSLGQHIEELDLLVGDQNGEKNKRELRVTVDTFRETLLRLRRDSRAALLVSKRVIDSQKSSLRDELLKSSAAKGTLNEKVTEDTLMKANADVTEALRRTVGLMQGELERSVLSSQMLESSTATLRSTSTMQDTLTNLMGTSKQLITALEKSDWLDRLLIISALVFFFLVVLFILKQRILDRSVRIAFWWTRFIPDFSGDAHLYRLAEEASLTTSTTTAMTTATATATEAITTAITGTRTLADVTTSLLSEITLDALPTNDLQQSIISTVAQVLEKSERIEL